MNTHTYLTQDVPNHPAVWIVTAITIVHAGAMLGAMTLALLGCW